MICNETSIFIKQIQRLLSEDSYRMLKMSLMLRLDAGELDSREWRTKENLLSLRGSGKRGALRIIYHWDPFDTIFMLFPYKKTKQEDLTQDQRKLLCKKMKELLL